MRMRFIYFTFTALFSKRLCLQQKKQQQKTIGKCIYANLTLPVLYTCNSSTIPSFPPPKTTISSFIATALCPCLGRGTGPDHPRTRFHRGCRTDAVVPDTAEPGADMTSVRGKNKRAFVSNAYFE